MAKSEIKFEGSPPFGLPAIQSAQASALDDTVVLTLYAVLPGQGPAPVPIHAQMAGRIAIAVGGQLSAAGLIAETRSRS